MKKFILVNWFKLAVLILLVMIYSKLDGIKENTFYTADMVDASATRVVNSLERVENGIDSIYRSQ